MVRKDAVKMEGILLPWRPLESGSSFPKKFKIFLIQEMTSGILAYIWIIKLGHGLMVSQWTNQLCSGSRTSHQVMERVWSLQRIIHHKRTGSIMTWAAKRSKDSFAKWGFPQVKKNYTVDLRTNWIVEILLNSSSGGARRVWTPLPLWTVFFRFFHNFSGTKIFAMTGANTTNPSTDFIFSLSISLTRWC